MGLDGVVASLPSTLSTLPRNSASLHKRTKMGPCDIHFPWVPCLRDALLGVIYALVMYYLLGDRHMRACECGRLVRLTR